MCRLFLSINVKLDDITLMNFFTQSNKKANTPGLSNPLDSDYHLDGYGIFWLDDTNELALYKSAEPYILDYNYNPKDRKSTRLNSSHLTQSRMPSSA